ncbi:hypothetical protein HanRHA438_Chr13g0627041 [Helianthus annuus]|nr:hypothetical protein HanRHA438_Chr13g0627041 [Helianthus annuus]
MRNNVTNVVEFANGVSEESLEKMQNLHADFNRTIMQFQWMNLFGGNNTIRRQIYMLCGVMMYLLVMMWRKEITIPYQPYAIGRVKFDAFQPERWFHHIVAFIHKASLSLQLCRNTRGTKNLFGSRICVCAADEGRSLLLFKLIHDLAYSYLVQLDTRKWIGKWFMLKKD